MANLLCWIAEKPVQLEAQDFPDSLPAVQQLLVAFASSHTQEKPLQLQQRWATEVLLFRLQTALRAQNRGPFLPQRACAGQAWSGQSLTEPGPAADSCSYSA